MVLIDKLKILYNKLNLNKKTLPINLSVMFFLIIELFRLDHKQLYNNRHSLYISGGDFLMICAKTGAKSNPLLILE